ncbi:T9SS type A sorting domain-containing protein [Cryomorphaceae bacterium]|nr:T9SS type A sorting domain-containing protein [Cryomorphaceae bacterium]
MRSRFFLLALLISAAVSAQDIATARQQAIGTVVTVSGIVTHGDELGIIRYVQDATAGIACYPGSGSVPFSVNPGDSVSITGPLKDYNGLLEVDPITSYTVHSSGNPIPAPVVITVPQMDEPYEGQLVRVNGITFTNGGGTFSVGTYNFSDAGGNVGTIYVRNGHPLLGELVPLGSLDMVGIMSQFTFTGFGGYQLLPRDTSDLIFGSSIVFASGVEQDNLSTSGFDLSWLTSSNGSTNVRYGLTPALELGDINNGGSNTGHVISLTGLTAGTIYYVQPYSVSGSDTAWGNLGAYATESNSTGAMMVYFNTLVDTSVALYDPAITLDGYFNDTIAAYIDRAQNTLDIAIYNADNQLIANAINAAQNRGVRVRFLYEGGNLNNILNDLNPSVPVLERPDGQAGIMHNKFVVVDADDVNNSWVLTGATNWTPGQLFDDPNDLLIIQDQSLARTYELEMDEMWGGSQATPNASNAKWGADKLDNTPHQFKIGGIPTQCYFSPSDGVTGKIVETIETTQERADFAVMTFTRDECADALIDVNGQFGKSVQGIIENINDQGGEYQTLIDAGIPVVDASAVSNIMHHKYIIIDYDRFFDAKILTGSHNWSSSAENSNDENTLIIENPILTDLYFQSFTALYNGGVSVEERLNLDMTIFPQPSHDIFNVALTAPAAGKGALVLYDMEGRVVLERSTEWTGAEQTITIDHHLRSGVYMMELRGEGWHAFDRIVRQ